MFSILNGVAKLIITLCSMSKSFIHRTVTGWMKASPFFANEMKLGSKYPKSFSFDLLVVPSGNIPTY